MVARTSDDVLVLIELRRVRSQVSLHIVPFLPDQSSLNIVLKDVLPTVARGYRGFVVVWVTAHGEFLADRYLDLNCMCSILSLCRLMF